MEGLNFDTSFLIDFQRERLKDKGRAHAFLKGNRDAVAYLSIVAYGEYAEGFTDLSSAAFISVVVSFELLPVDRKVADCYAEISRQLRLEGRLIGANDLWIAAVSLVNELPLVTGNSEHFQRVPGLRVVGYR
jgi:predicted nucleic acid-binding protein